MTKSERNNAFSKMLKEFPKVFGRVSFRERLMLGVAFDYAITETHDLENKLLGERCNQLLKDKGELIDKIADIKANCDLAIEGRDIKIKELEQQIERAVDIIRDLGSTVREGVTCHYLVDNGGLHRATLFIKEIKEND